MTPRHTPDRYLTQTRTDLDHISRIITSRYETLTLLADPLTATSYDNTTTSTSGHSDPTPTAAQHLAHWHTLDSELSATAAELAGNMRRIVHLVNQIPTDIDTARLAELHACNGMGLPGYDKWGDPLCKKIIGEHSVNRVCDTCRQRYDSYRRNPDGYKRRIPKEPA